MSTIKKMNYFYVHKERPVFRVHLAWPSTAVHCSCILWFMMTSHTVSPGFPWSCWAIQLLQRTSKRSSTPVCLKYILLNWSASNSLYFILHQNCITISILLMHSISMMLYQSIYFGDCGDHLDDDHIVLLSQCLPSYGKYSPHSAAMVTLVVIEKMKPAG